ncbi:MAG: hypothetical protein PHD32_10835 [Eubacteriales bacterium]|nr:hypothetical protein [Eubacteriales bacterium]
MRKTALFLAAVLLCAGLAGCKAGEKEVTAQAAEKPASNLPGYYAAEQALSGGRELYGQNLSDIQVSSDSGDTVITLNFMSGSLQLGMEETASAGVPSYTTSHIAGLNRLVLHIQGLIFWDYKVFKDELNSTPVNGILQEVPINTEETRLYISIKDEYAYQISEQGNKLIIRLRALNKADDVKWYATMNAFNEYSDGLLPETLGLTPTLSSDRVNAVMISQPFDTQEAAEAFAQELKSGIQALPDGEDADMLKELKAMTVGVVKLANSQLPDFSEQGALEALSQSNVLQRGDTAQGAPALVSNGRFLCYTPDAASYVFARPFFLSDEDGGMTIYEKIYTSTVGEDVPQLLLEFEFVSVTQARFSPDGQYLAFLDQTSMTRSLYIYDLANQTLIAAAEEGMGDDTAAFAWAGSGHTLYAISGELDVLELMKLEIGGGADGANAVSRVGNMELTSGDMDLAGDTIYVAQSGGEWEDGIYAINTGTAAHEKVCDGYSFLLNKKDGRLLVMEDAQDGAYNLKVVTPADGNVMKVAENQDIGEVAWDADGSYIYYTVFDSQTGDAQYPVTLYQFKLGEAQAQMRLVNGQLFGAGSGGQVLMVYVYSQNGQFIPVTYVLDMAAQE